MRAAKKLKRVDEKVTIERLEQALIIVARIMVRDGDVYAPIFERLERELENMKNTQSVMERARHLLSEIDGDKSGSTSNNQ